MVSYYTYLKLMRKKILEKLKSLMPKDTRVLCPGCSRLFPNDDLFIKHNKVCQGCTEKREGGVHPSAIRKGVNLWR